MLSRDIYSEDNEHVNALRFGKFWRDFKFATVRDKSEIIL